MENGKRFTTLAAMLFASAFFLSATAGAQQNTKLSDPEIASVAVTANQVDITAAEQAIKKTTNDEVRNFAQTMINDHQSVIDKATALVQKLHVTPKDNALSQKLSSDAAKTRQSLSTKSGKAFDRAYIDNEVAYHKAVIAAVEGKLIPESQNAELKDLLQTVLPVLKTHLEHAEMVQKKIAGK
jgi:putative membrane protein